MTKIQMKNNAKKYMATIKEEVEKEVARLINSGGIDFESEDKESFAKVKAIYKTALENVAGEILLNSTTKEDYFNLRNF